MNKYIFLKTIQRFSGSFHQNLACAMQSADSHNFERILIAFPELLEEYGPGTTMYEIVYKEHQAEKERDARILGLVLI